MGRGQPLETGRNVRRFPQGQLFLPPSTAHITDHDHTRMYPDPYSEWKTFASLQPCIQFTHDSKDT
jgi:hypothetical protein